MGATAKSRAAIRCLPVALILLTATPALAQDGPFEAPVTGTGEPGEIAIRCAGLVQILLSQEESGDMDLVPALKTFRDRTEAAQGDITDIAFRYRVSAADIIDADRDIWMVEAAR